MGRVSRNASVLRLGPDGPRRRSDPVAVEEPLEVRVNGERLMVTMRTPGDDIDLVHGLLHSEGVIADVEDVALARYCAGSGPDGVNTYNVLDVSLAAGVAPPSADCQPEGGHHQCLRHLRQHQHRPGAAPVPVPPAHRPPRAGRPGRVRPGTAAGAAAGLRADRWGARCGPAGPRRRHGVCPGGRRSAQRRGQGGRLGDPAAATPVGRHVVGCLRAGLVRADPEGGAGRHRHAGRRVCAQHVGHRPGR